MNDDKPKERLLAELAALRRRIADLKISEAEYKKAEEKIRQQNEFLYVVLESLSHPFYVVDIKDYTVKLANSTAKLGDKKTCYEFSHGYDTPCNCAGNPCPLEEVKKTKKAVVMEHLHRDVGGTPNWAEVHAYPICDDKGNVSQVIIYSLDITQRKKMEEALQKSHDELELRVQERTKELIASNEAVRASEQKFRTLVQSMQETVFTLDRDRRIVEIFGPWFENTGLLAEKCVNKTFDKIFNLNTISFKEDSIGRVFAGEPVVFEWMTQSKNRNVYLQTSLSPIYNSKGEIEGAVGVGRDISKQKQLEKQLLQSEKLMAVGEMSMMISHEFRNALTSVRMILELQLESDNLSSSEKESLSVALGSVQHMESLVTQLLSFARPTPMVFKPDGLKNVIEEALDFVKMQMSEKQITAKKSIDASLPPMALDKKHFKEALINIFLNAIQAIANNPGENGRREILVSSKRHVLKEKLEDYSFSYLSEQEQGDPALHREMELVLPRGTESVVIEVSDSGPGIEHDKLLRIFDPFFTTKTSGTGLGLAMVKRTVNAHGGIVTAESAFGQGTTFKIFLPL